MTCRRWTVETVYCCHVAFTESAIFSDAVRSEYQQSLGALGIHGWYPDGVFACFSFLAVLPFILSVCL